MYKNTLYFHFQAQRASILLSLLSITQENDGVWLLAFTVVLHQSLSVFPGVDGYRA